MTPLCFLDTETTGVHPGRRAWEVAMIRRDDAGQRELAFYVDVDLSGADPFGLKVGRFHERHPRGRWFAGLDRDDPACDFGHTADEHHHGRMVTEVVAAILVSRWTHGAHLVGAVPDFDARTLDALLRDNELIPAWHYHLIDVEAMAVGWLTHAARQELQAGNDNDADLLAMTAAPPWRSDDLSLACGVEPPGADERHTALGDARWAMRWYDAMTGADQ